MGVVVVEFILICCIILLAIVLTQACLMWRINIGGVFKELAFRIFITNMHNLKLFQELIYWQEIRKIEN